MIMSKIVLYNNRQFKKNFYIDIDIKKKNK